jgi:hypothetical protein
MQDRTTPTFTVETITPEIAAEYLTHNAGNRPVSKTQLDKIAAAMTNGTYRMTGDAIRFGADGRVYDGQHRLHACVKSGVSFTTLVVRNLDAATLLVIDSGKTRSAADQLHIASGIAKPTVDTVQMLLRMGIGHKGYLMTTTDTLNAIIARHPVINTTVEAYADSAKFQLGGNIPAGELILRALGYQEEADAWRQTWAAGEKNPLAEAAFAFRNRLAADPDKQKGQRFNLTTRRNILASVIVKTMTQTAPAKFFVVRDVHTFPTITPENLMTTTDFTTVLRLPMAQTISNPRNASGMKSLAKKRSQAREEPSLPFETTAATGAA